MKHTIIAAIVASCAFTLTSGAAQDGFATKDEIRALIERIGRLEAENKAQARRIAELESRVAHDGTAQAQLPKPKEQPAEEKGAGNEAVADAAAGRLHVAESGRAFHLADEAKGIFEPLSDNGLVVTPYGWLVAEADYNTHSTEVDTYTDYVRPKSHRSYKDPTSVFSMQNSILGIRFETPEEICGWRYSGKAEFDFAGDHANDYAFHWRHLYFDATHDACGFDGEKNGTWSFLFGQTWHLWKMVTPSEIDGAWMENTGHPYRRSPQVRVTRKWEWEDSSLEARVGLVKNGPGMGGDRDGDGNQDNSASRWALVEGALVYDRVAVWEPVPKKDEPRRWLVGVGGMYGRDRLHSASEWGDEGEPIAYDGSARDYDTDMVMFAASVPFLGGVFGEDSGFTLCGQIFAGENLGGVQAGVGQRVAFKPERRHGKSVRTVGGFADLKYKHDKKWSFALGYGFDNPNDSDARYADGICYNDRAYIDAFYRVNANLHFGVEYAYLTTKYDVDGRSNDNRIQLTAFYDF
ncbi:MAG: DUF2312 domain-containing protein [Kiritimatiellae bacterium]|nr:DUF2312 domain-containing protein [Kiritimatiellia bacterium]